jgi:hypothetical protein
MTKVKIFNYIPELAAFVVTDEYRKLADTLNLSEWNPIVRIGRLFTLDNDFGEHWFDNWELREEKKEQAESMGFCHEELMIIDPERLRDGRDGPCNLPELRKAFWTEVLDELKLSHNFLFDKARDANEKIKSALPNEYVLDLEERIKAIKKEKALL